jgi:hypothetical protein
VAPFAKTTFVQGSAPAATAAELNNFGDGIVEAQRQPWVTLLPTTGPGGGALVDGQECYYKPDPTNATGNGGVGWHLKYDGGSAKWYYIGGSALGYFKAASVLDSVVSAAYANLPTTGAAAALVVPLAGEYELELSGRGDAQTTSQTFLAVKRGAAAASDDDAIAWRGDNFQSNSRVWRMAGLAAATTLLLQAKLVGQVTSRVWEIGFTILPVRVG